MTPTRTLWKRHLSAATALGLLAVGTVLLIDAIESPRQAQAAEGRVIWIEDGRVVHEGDIDERDIERMVEGILADVDVDGIAEEVSAALEGLDFDLDLDFDGESRMRFRRDRNGRHEMDGFEFEFDGEEFARKMERMARQLEFHLERNLGSLEHDLGRNLGHLERRLERMDRGDFDREHRRHRERVRVNGIDRDEVDRDERELRREIEALQRQLERLQQELEGYEREDPDGR